MQVGEGATRTPRLLPHHLRQRALRTQQMPHGNAPEQSSGHTVPASPGCRKQRRRGLQHMRPFLPALELGGPAGRSMGRTLLWLAGGPPLLPAPSSHDAERAVAAHGLHL